MAVLLPADEEAVGHRHDAVELLHLDPDLSRACAGAVGWQKRSDDTIFVMTQTPKHISITKEEAVLGMSKMPTASGWGHGMPRPSPSSASMHFPSL